MAKLYIAEFLRLAVADGKSVPALQQPPIATQVVDFTAGETDSAAFHAKTELVEIHTDSICSIAFGTSPTATTSHPRLIAGDTRVYGVVGGHKVSAIINT